MEPTNSAKAMKGRILGYVADDNIGPCNSVLILLCNSDSQVL